MAAQWGEVGQSGTVSFSMGPLVPDKQYWVITLDEASNGTVDTCTISQAITPTYEATFNVTESGTGTPISDALVTVTGQDPQSTNGSGETVFTDLENGNYPYEVTASGYVTETGSITIDGENETENVEMTLVTLVNELATNIIIYPNPVTNTLFIKNANDFETVSIYNACGKLVCSDRLNGKTEIDFSAISNGLYFVKLIGTKNVSVIKIFKK